MSDGFVETFGAARDFCESRVTAPHLHGTPIIVCSTLDADVVFPPLEVTVGMPVVELVVASDGVWVIASRFRDRVARPFWSVFHRYPLGPDGVPSLAAQAGADWRTHLDIDVAVAVGLLPATGQALAGP